MEEKYSDLECPFTWDIPEYDSTYIKDKMDQNKSQSMFLINGFSMLIFECFETSRRGDYVLALSIAKECERALDEYTPTGRFEEEDKYLLEKCSEGFRHIVYSTQAELASKNENSEMAEEIRKKIKPSKLLDCTNTAGLLAVKSRFLMIYGPSKEVIDLMKEATALDDTVALWHHLLGKALAGNRRSTNNKNGPTKQEIDELNKAWKMSNRPDYGVFLLQSYQNLRPKIDDQVKLELLLRETKEAAGEEWYIYNRLAYIVMKINCFQVSMRKKYAEELINLATEFSKNCSDAEKSSLYITKCYYSYIFERNYHNTLEYAKKAIEFCGDFGCIKYTMKMSYQLEKGSLVPLYDEFLSLLNKEYTDVRKATLIHKANYIMYIKKDLKEAFKIYEELMKDTDNYKYFQNCQPLFPEDKQFCSLIKSLQGELSARKYAILSDISLIDGYLKKINEFQKLNERNENVQ